jgi:hypothetical protein
MTTPTGAIIEGTKRPTYREGGFEVIAFDHGLVAFTVNATGQWKARAGEVTRPPHWGIWRGIVHRSSSCPPELDEAGLEALLGRAQKALRCKERYYDKVAAERRP